MKMKKELKIVVSSDSFKGSLSAIEVAKAVKKGIIKVFPSAVVNEIPLADGGEGTVEVLVRATGGKVVKVETVSGPLGKKISSYFGLLGHSKTAVVEMAAASGLTLIPVEKRNPLKTTTYGTGELIKAALDRGCKKVIIGLGGSATVDAGAGMAQALGVRLLDRRGREIGFGGEELLKLQHIDLDGIKKYTKHARFVAASDVDNPLCGANGAVPVYAPQKGASASMIRILSEALEHFASVTRKELGIDVAGVPGSGAAGGLGAGCYIFLNAALKRGVDITIELTNLKRYLPGANLIITGEGKMDGQTAWGKTPYGVAKLAGKYGIPVLGITGILGDDVHRLYKKGFTALTGITPSPMTLEECVNEASRLIEDAIERAMRLVKLGSKL